MDAVEELEERLSRGEWLLPGEVATLLSVSRSTVIRVYLNPDPPKIRYRVRPGSGQYRECHPDDVRRELDARRQVHGDR
ncbi:hypothetical protein [Micromonospora aurantiaca (nom. illeg.)]|uniref:hypothetical protein n=1 Tax=Micromonospora aurantiaca (nom. illeg.) TaxID=47850 RepID=UPI0033D62CB6